MIILKTIMVAQRDKREEIVQTLVAMIETMRNEEGCLDFQVFRNIKNEASFSLVGEWETREALFQHIRSDNFSVVLGTKSLLSCPIQIQVLTVSNCEGRELITAIRSNTLPSNS